MLTIRRRQAHNARGFPGVILRLDRGNVLCSGLKFALFAPSYLDLVNERAGVFLAGVTGTQFLSAGSGASATRTTTLGMAFDLNGGIRVEYSYLPAINPPFSVYAFADFGTGTMCSMGGSGTGRGWCVAMNASATGLRSRMTFGGVADYILAADIPNTTANGGVYTHVWTVDKNGGTFNAYLNGVSAGTGVTVGTMLSITQPFDVGTVRTATGVGTDFTKAIGCVCVWNRVISPVEIAMLHVDPYQLLAPRERIFWGHGVLFRPRPMSIMS
jgi:hypothetical protein